MFTGNELAALLGWWMLFNWRERNPPPADPSSLYMLATCVSSRILRTMAKQEGFRFEVGGPPPPAPRRRPPLHHSSPPAPPSG